jgi:uncharacterized damage-inducible protein DinB
MEPPSTEEAAAMPDLGTHLRMMAAYNRWANRRLYAEAARLPDAPYRQDAGAFFRSLHGTLNHLLATDRIWMRRMEGRGEAPDRLDAILFEEFEPLRAAREAEDARILAHVEGLSPADLAAEFEYATTRGAPQRQPRWQALAHLFNHQTHHRGQAHAILTRLGVAEPASLDLLAMQREMARGEAV